MSLIGADWWSGFVPTRWRWDAGGEARAPMSVLVEEPHNRASAAVYGERRPRHSAEEPRAVTLSSHELTGFSILVVDDELDARELVACLLESRGATVYLADAPTAALTLLARHTPDVMISDIAMPGEDGYALMRRVRSLKQAEKRNIPAIALTAFTRNVDRERALVAGFDVHLGKPVQPSVLMAAVVDLTRAA
jgi:CheY-like chemotaxis protein